MTIQIENLRKTYRKTTRNHKPALNNLSLQVSRGEVFGFLGPNGAGKSTLIKILLDFIRPDSGRALIKGVPVNTPQARRAIGFLPENPFFYDHLNAEEILDFGGRAAGMNRVIIADRADMLLTRLKLDHAKKQRLRTYSKGMLQRIGLALTLIHEPEICILDEPMSGLDPLGRRLVADLIMEMRDNGQTVFFSSHILSDIEKLCDRIGILNHGRLLYCGSVEEMLRDSASSDLEQAFINLIEQDERDTHGADLAVR